MAAFTAKSELPFSSLGNRVDAVESFPNSSNSSKKSTSALSSTQPFDVIGIRDWIVLDQQKMLFGSVFCPGY
jgi:hypothetical protein